MTTLGFQLHYLISPANIQWGAWRIKHHNNWLFVRRNLALTVYSAQRNHNWKTRVVMIPTLSSLLAPQVVLVKTCGANSDDKVSMRTNNASFVVIRGAGGCRCDNLRYHQCRQIWHRDNFRFLEGCRYDNLHLPAVTTIFLSCQLSVFKWLLWTKDFHGIVSSCVWLVIASMNPMTWNAIEGRTPLTIVLDISTCINPLAPGWCDYDMKLSNFKPMSVTDISRIYIEKNIADA